MTGRGRIHRNNQKPGPKNKNGAKNVNQTGKSDRNWDQTTQIRLMGKRNLGIVQEVTSYCSESMNTIKYNTTQDKTITAQTGYLDP